jgi:hypothetical protein
LKRASAARAREAAVGDPARHPRLGANPQEWVCAEWADYPPFAQNAKDGAPEKAKADPSPHPNGRKSSARWGPRLVVHPHEDMRTNFLGMTNMGASARWARNDSSYYLLCLVGAD